MRKTFKLGRPELTAEIEQGLKKARNQREQQRLLALRLGQEGAHTLEEIAGIVGRARSRVAEWMRVARTEGVAALLGRHQGRGRAPRVSGTAFKELRHGVRRGRWKRAKEAQAWLAQRHGVAIGLTSTRNWLKKAGES